MVSQCFADLKSVATIYISFESVIYWLVSNIFKSKSPACLYSILNT